MNRNDSERKRNESATPAKSAHGVRAFYAGMLVGALVSATATIALALNSSTVDEQRPEEPFQEWRNDLDYSVIATVFAFNEEMNEEVETAPETLVIEPDEEIPSPAPRYADEEVALIAKTVYGEARGINSDMEMAAVAWCILNRVDSPYYPDTIEGVVTQNQQFHGYNASFPVDAYIEVIVRDVLDRWFAEKDGVEDSGRILPKDYIYFEGDGKHNHYTTKWLGTDYWDWSLPNPYES